MQRLHEQGVSLKEKVQLKSEVIRRQEALVVELRQRLSEGEQRIVTAETSISSISKKEETGRIELETARQRLKEAESLIENNKKVYIIIYFIFIYRI